LENIDEKKLYYRTNNLLSYTGPNGEECSDYEVPDDGSGSVESCELSTFGCCPDRASPSPGPDGEGCEDQTTTADETVQPVDVVEDGKTTASCGGAAFGCCPDGSTPARGDDLEGCPDSEDTVIAVEWPPVRANAGEDGEAGCDRAEYGCCIDGATAATGPNFDGCTSEDDRAYEESCIDEPYGCCPDGVTSALGPELAGCGHRMQTAGKRPTFKHIISTHVQLFYTVYNTLRSLSSVIPICSP